MPLVKPPLRQPEEIAEINRRADYFEALFRARFIRAMEELRETLTEADLMAVFGPGGRRTANPLLVAKIEAIIKKHIGDVITRSFLQGGKMGQMNIHRLG